MIRPEGIIAVAIKAYVEENFQENFVKSHGQQEKHDSLNYLLAGLEIVPKFDGPTGYKFISTEMKFAKATQFFFNPNFLRRKKLGRLFLSSYPD